MQEKIYYTGALALSALALIILVADISVANGNRKLQQQINERQTVINNGMELSKINQSLVQGLADLANNNNDAELRKLLNDQGITFKPKAETSKAAVESAEGSDKTKPKSK